MAAQTRQGVREAPAVELRGVSCRTADGSLILDDVNLRVSPGECVLLCGRSGMGKTTVTKCINGLIPQFEPGIERIGDVEVRGLDPAACEMYELARRVGSVFQNPKSQFFNLTSNDELAFGLEAAGEDADVIERRIGETVTALRAERLLGRSVTKMSGGEKQSLVFASVDVMSPDVYVLDEPTANLDAEAVRVLHDQIAAILAHGKTVIVAEHRLYFMAAPEPLERGLSLRGFSCVRKAGRVFSPVDLDVPRGAVVGVMGANGAGKTTLVRAVAGLERACEGAVCFDGASLRRKERRRACSLVMQDVNHQLFSDSVRGECELAAGSPRDADGVSGLGSPAARIDEVLAALDLAHLEERHPMALSGGQKQRLAIACALLAGREALLLDEPTSGLDLRHMMEVGRLVRTLAERNICIVVVSHDCEFLSCCCDCVYELEGR